jgi:hypothetical protein
MRQRCQNPNNHKYSRYGQRGIEVCDEWNENFKAFNYWAHSHGYERGLTIDRVDVNGNYEPSNCRWVDQKTQQNNRGNNFKLTVNGVTRTASEWSEVSKFTASAIRQRYEKQRRSAYESVYGGDPRPVLITIGRVTKNASDWNMTMGYRKGLVISRVERGWDPIKAVITPPRKGNYRHG